MTPPAGLISLLTASSRYFAMTSKDQGRKLLLDISTTFTNRDSNIIGCHRNAFLTDEESNKVSKPDIETASKLIMKSISVISTYSTTH